MAGVLQMIHTKTTRRGFIGGLAAAFAAPAIVRAASLMPVKAMPDTFTVDHLRDILRAMSEIQPPPLRGWTAIIDPSMLAEARKCYAMLDWERSLNARIIERRPIPIDADSPFRYMLNSQDRRDVNPHRP